MTNATNKSEHAQSQPVRSRVLKWVAIGVAALAVLCSLPWLYQWVTRESYTLVYDVVVDGKQVKLVMECSETRLIGDPRAFSIGGGDWRCRCKVSVDGVPLADVTTTAKPGALWRIDARWYLVCKMIDPRNEEWYVLRLDGGHEMTRVPRFSLPPATRPWNLAEPDQARGIQDRFDDKDVPG